jgi:class 3 adenylate cyclase
MICPRCETTNPPQARFCFNCGYGLVLRCANCQSELQPQARFCMHCGEPVITQTPLDASRQQRLSAAAPAPLVEKLRTAPALSGERRPVTVLLVDVVKSTSLANQVDVNTWTTILNRAFDQIAPIIFRYEGTIARLLGDTLLAFFGAPVAHEDDPLRATLAALDVIETGQAYSQFVHQQYGLEFGLRACLNTGTILVGKVGTDLKYEYEAADDTVNLASRIKFAAGPFNTLVTSETYRHIQPLFDFAELDPLSVKGTPEPVHVYSVLGRKTQPGQVRGLAGLESPMVGRAAELQTLLHLCEAVQAGLGRAVLVTGEPGLGKTRLINEWHQAVMSQANQSRLPDAPVPQWTEGRCLSFGSSQAYNLLSSWLRSAGSLPEGSSPETRAALEIFLLNTLPAEANAVAPLFIHLLGLPDENAALVNLQSLDPEALQAQLVEALRKLVRAMAARQPLVLILEDLHWADPSSCDVFRQLLPLAAELPVLLCLVIRQEEETPGWHLVTAARRTLRGRLAEIPLNALSESDSRQLVANLLEIDALPEHTRQVILQKAEGNPFFVEEVIRMLIDRGVIEHHEDGWVAGKEIDPGEIPDQLEGLLLARIDRLPEDVRETLRIAAVIGRQFPLRVLAEVLERNTGDESAEPTKYP